MRRGEIYATTGEIAAVVCAPIYSGLLELDTEVTIDTEQGLPKTSSIPSFFCA